MKLSLAAALVAAVTGPVLAQGTAPAPAPAPSPPPAAQATPPTPPPAAASDATAKAEALYREGKRYYDVADYDHAIDVWKRAYLISSAPMLLFNIGQAYRLEGDCVSALRFYANFERDDPKADHTDVDQAKTRCNPQPTDAKPPPSYPPPSADHAADLEATRPIDRLDLPSDPGGGLRAAGLATGITGVVLLGVSGFLADRASSDASTVAGFRGEWTQTQRDTEQNGESAALWSKISLGVGLAGLATGIVLYKLGVQHRHVDVALTPHAAGVTWAASF